MTLDCSEIIQGRLWLGSYPRVEDVIELEQMGITAVVSLQDETDLDHFGISMKKLRHVYDQAGIALRWYRIRDFDKGELLEKLDGGVTELEAALIPATARVYLHCTAGMNRAPTVAAAYLMRAQGLTAQDAYDYVVERRYCRPYQDVLAGYGSSLRLKPPDR